MKAVHMIAKAFLLTALVIVIIPVTIAFAVTTPIWAPTYLYLSRGK